MVIKPHAKDNVLTSDEISKLLLACRDEKERLIFLCLVYSGLRISEFIHLNRNWIEKNFISIPETQKCSCNECKKEIYRVKRDKNTKNIIEKRLIKPSGVWRVKTESAKRLIIILPEFKDVLEKYLKIHNSIMETIKSRVEGWKILKRVAKRVGLKNKVFPHSLRSTYATILASKGFDAIQIRNMLGWRNIAMAEEYIKFDKERIERMFKEKW